MITLLNSGAWRMERFLKPAQSFYAAGRDDAFAGIAAKLKTDLTFGLTGSTEWASRVMWPLELAGHPYFALRNIEPANWREKLSSKFFGPDQEYFLTKEVRTFLEKQRLDNLKNRKE